MTMREKIKEAIGNGQNYERDADAIVGAVLDAMREPPPWMIEAGAEHLDEAPIMAKSDEDAEACWPAMIDAAKGETE